MKSILENKTILVVDDEDVLRMLLKYEFEDLGCNVIEAPNGHVAFELIKSNKVDAVITDVRMPGGDGIELLENIKKLNYDTPVVLLVTGYSDISNAEAYAKGAEVIYSKPYKVDEIIKTIELCLIPRMLRWKRKTERIPAYFHLNLKIPNLSENNTFQVINFGRGGMFVKLESNIPINLGLIEFEIKVEVGNIKTISGIGILRWIRQASTQEHPAGCGIEFLELSDNCLQDIISLIDTLKLKYYIPLA